jgi:hypothetical protein
MSTSLDRRRKITMIMWGSLALAVAATLWWRLATRGDDAGEIEYHCKPAGPRQIECVFAADRDAPSVCVRLELACDDGAHQARVCSGPLKKGEDHSVMVTELEPPLPESPRCAAPRYSDVSVLE